MKHVLFSFAVLSLLAVSPAFSEVPVAHLTTKNYVDTGLKSVYSKIKALNTATQADLDELTVYVGAPAVGDEPASGLTGQIDTLAADVRSIEDRVVYTDNDSGVLVTADRKVGILGLDHNTKISDKMYLFKNNRAVELDVADTWSVPEPEGE